MVCVSSSQGLWAGLPQHKVNDVCEVVCEWTLLRKIRLVCPWHIASFPWVVYMQGGAFPNPGAPSGIAARAW